MKKPTLVKINDVVKPRGSNQKGTVIGQDGGFWVVKFANGNTSKYSSNQLEVC